MDQLTLFLIGLLVGIALTVAAAAAWRFALRRGSGNTTAADGSAASPGLTTVPTEHFIEVSKRAVAAEAQAAELRAQVHQLLDHQQHITERERLAMADESRVLQTLAPVRETLRTMHEKVAQLERERAGQYSALAQQMNQAQINGDQLRATTESLASALRNNSIRGVWGETQLRNVVEAAGLTQRVDFDVQTSIRSDAGTGRPDMTVRLPGGKSIAVDAKVPYNAYIEASSIPATATGDEAARRTALLAQHVKAVRGHIDALAAKSYWSGLDASPEFVIAFIPNESLLAAALEADPALLDYSFSKRVALASPVNLWAVLKTVAYTWQQDVLTDDAKRLFDLGKELYQRLSVLSEHSDKLRKAIESTVNSYNQFASSLETRVLVTARKLDALDESKVIGTPSLVDTVPRHLTATEFSAEPGLAHPERLATSRSAEQEEWLTTRLAAPEPTDPPQI
ncbi:DNA recombination protein RmuC [Lysinibacter cavernae]|uniref:DNA recombination protein RmuC n=1 Tax=Lysinibacter cavernae TaxID=1640652 RepID=A0A7X5TRJ6_9MICO|nr:DNA recombination protein RmuC [Lysinibacter cavernae]NIH52266.1 DNA recombination protein RmuC [Lysinibacter cavernae]